MLIRICDNGAVLGYRGVQFREPFIDYNAGISEDIIERSPEYKELADFAKVSYDYENNSHFDGRDSQVQLEVTQDFIRKIETPGSGYYRISES